VYRLQMAANERPSKVDPLKVMLLGLEVRDLPDIVADGTSVLDTNFVFVEMIEVLT